MLLSFGNWKVTVVYLRIIIFTFLLVTSPGNAANKMLTGVCFHPDRMSISATETLDLLKKYQFYSYRTDFRWREIEKKKGVYKIPYEKLQVIVDGSLKARITPIIILGSANPLYGDSKPVTEEQRIAFTHYVSWVVDQYPHTPIIYEIYNEWWNDDFKNNPESNDAISAKNYSELIKEASQTIRMHNPNAIIIAGSLNPLSTRHRNWFYYMIKDGVLNNIDGVSIHPYSKHSPDKDFSVIDLFEKYLTRMNSGKKVSIFITEMGYSNSIRGLLPPVVQESYTHQYFRLASERSYIKGLWWYSLTDEKSVNPYVSNFGLLDINGKEKDIAKGYLKWSKIDK